MSRYTGLFRLYPKSGQGADGFTSHDRELIKQSILNIIKTPKGSRVYDPDYGTNLHRLIHDLNNERTRNIAKNEIMYAVEKYEPRAKITRIEAYAQGELNSEVVVMMNVLYYEFNDTEILEYKFATDAMWTEKKESDYDPLEDMYKPGV